MSFVGERLTPLHAQTMNGTYGLAAGWRYCADRLATFLIPNLVELKDDAGCTLYQNKYDEKMCRTHHADLWINVLMNNSVQPAIITNLMNKSLSKNVTPRNKCTQYLHLCQYHKEVFIYSLYCVISA